MTPTERILELEKRDRQAAAFRPTVSPAADIRALIKRVEDLERAHNGVTSFLNGPAEDDFGGMLGSRTGKLHARCDALEARVDRLTGECKKLIADEFKSRAPMIYRGIWSNTADYLVGDLVTHGGGGWVCRADHRDQRPGSGGAWQLAIKAA